MAHGHQSARSREACRDLKEELRELLLAGLDSGEPKPVTDQDWEALRRRALAGTEINDE